MFKPSLIDPKCLKCDTKPLFSWKSEVVMECVVFVSGRPPGVHCVVSPWCEGWFIFICVHSLGRGHSHRALEFMSWMLMLLLKSISYSFPGRKFPRFWEVPTLEEWIWHRFLLQAKSLFLSPSPRTCCLAMWSRRAVCLWRWRCMGLCGWQSPSSSLRPSRRCQRQSSASEESRFADK